VRANPARTLTHARVRHHRAGADVHLLGRDEESLAFAASIGFCNV
jgi:hypothetical protein